MKRLIYLIAFIFMSAVLVSCTKDNSLKIKLDANGGLLPDGQSSLVIITSDDSVDLPAPIREGYNFTGWTDPEALNAKIKEITLYAKWEIKEFTVTFVGFDDELISTQTVEYDFPATAPENPQRPGNEEETYSFLGWDRPFDHVRSDLIVKALYEDNAQKYTVNFLDFNDSILKTEEVEYGERAIAPENPSRLTDVQFTYSFAGWDKPFDRVTSDLSIKAAYTQVERNFTVTFLNYDGSVYATEEVLYGQTSAAPSSPVRNDDPAYTYTFIGWDQDLSNVTENMVVNPIFESTQNLYTVSFVDYDDEVLSVQEIPYGRAALAPENPTREGFVFLKWDQDFTFVTSSILIRALFQEPFTEGLKFELAEDHYEITGYEGTALEVTIPSSYDGIPVQRICSYGFFELPVTKVTVGEGITEIGSSAFYHCAGLQNVILPETLTALGEKTFKNCPKLASVNIPTKISEIKDETFFGCSALQNIFLPEGVTDIGDNAFRDCSALQTIYIPASVTSLGRYVLTDDHQLAEATLPFNDSATTLSYYFMDETGYFPYYDYYYFQTLHIAEGTTKIYKNSLYYRSLKTISLPVSLKVIDENAFNGCDGLTTLVIPENIELDYIGRYAFYGLYNFTTLFFNSVKVIASNAFSDSYFAKITINSVTEIQSNAFNHCSNLKELTINSGLTAIPDSAFYSCYSLEKIVLPQTLTSFGNNAFKSCSKLASITIPDSVTTIGNYCFQYCASLTGIIIPMNVTSMGYSAFDGCNSLTVYCEASSQPGGWNDGWNGYFSPRPVVWGYVEP
jgi:uncharacterized repeat protein (TIGR02543 family)